MRWESWCRVTERYPLGICEEIRIYSTFSLGSTCSVSYGGNSSIIIPCYDIILRTSTKLINRNFSTSRRCLHTSHNPKVKTSHFVPSTYPHYISPPSPFSTIAALSFLSPDIAYRFHIQRPFSRFTCNFPQNFPRLILLQSTTYIHLHFFHENAQLM